MKRLMASSLASVAVLGAMAATPAQGQPEKKTELAALGRSVDKMVLRYDFDSAWVVDNRSILYRDTSRDYYLVTLAEACEPLDIRGLTFDFHPAWSWQLRASRAYEVRPRAGPHCGVAKIEQVDDATANELHDQARWRAW